MIQLFTNYISDSLRHAHLSLFTFCEVIDLPHFEVGPLKMGPMTLTFELSRHFSTMHLSTKFHHPMFNHSLLQTKCVEGVVLPTLSAAGQTRDIYHGQTAPSHNF